MECLALKTLSIAFVALACITAGSSLIAEAGWFAATVPAVAIEALVILLAGAKMLIVAEFFMELNHAPAWLRRLMAGWTSAVVVMVVALNVYGGG